MLTKGFPDRNWRNLENSMHLCADIFLPILAIFDIGHDRRGHGQLRKLEESSF